MLLNDRGIRFNPEAIAPFDLALSTGITTDEWRLSMLHQPDLFIRIRRDKERILQILTEQGIRSQLINETCLALPNGSPIDKLLPENSYVVQDASSQQTGSFFSARPNESWWDCCSGAGGKSLLLKDKQPKIRLSVSDKRASILHNLEKRFQLYGLEKPVSYVADISDERSLKDNIVNAKFDNIICDVPCTGSGTWSRTPEQMFFFNREDALTLSKLQATIAINAEQRLKPGGSLYYITCSVFEQENENVVQEVVEQTGLQLADKQLINGIEQKADSMFIAVLKKD